MISSTPQVDWTDSNIMDQVAVATSVSDATGIANNNNNNNKAYMTTNSLTTITKAVRRPINSIKPTRKKRKATTVLAVGASRDTNRSLVGNTLNNVVDTTSTSTATGGISINEESTFTTTINNNQGVTENDEASNSESNRLLLQQQQLRSIHSHLPLELIPPIIPENTTGKPSLRMFCSSYPKPKKPRRMVQLRSTPNTVITNMTNTTTGTAVVAAAATTTTPTDGATRIGDNNNNKNNNNNSNNNTTTTTGWTDPSHILHTITDSHSQPQHTGPVVQIVNGEIVLQESSMVFQGSVAMGNPNHSLLGGNGNVDYAGIGLDGNHYNNNNNNNSQDYHLNKNNNNNSHNNTNHSNINNYYSGGMTVVEEEAEMAVVGATYTSFATGRRARPKVSHWTVEETELFYEALQQVGLDFGTMEAYFEAAALNPNNNNKNIRFRQRRQLKRKYQAEYNKNPKLIEKVLQCQGRVGIDLSVFHLSDDVVHSATESSESQLIEVNDNDGTTTSNERRNDLNTGASSSANQISQRPDNGIDRIKDPIINNENDDNETDTFPLEQNNETMYFEDGQQGDDQLNTPLILFNDNGKAKTSNTNVTVRHPPKIVTKPKAIRPIRSAATRTMKMKKNRVE